MQQTNLLDESNKFLQRLKNETKLREVKKLKRKYYIGIFKKWTIRVILFCLTIGLVFFPVEMGTIIGTWIHDFFGTIIKSTIK